MTNSNKFDVIIVGAGPSGTICAMQLAKKGFNIALIDKEIFPRDKICGDALSLDIENQLQRIDKDLAKRFLAFSNKMPSYGVSIIAPSTESFEIPFYYKGNKRTAFIAKRYDFDHFLFQELKNYPNIKIFEGFKVVELQTLVTGVEIVIQQKTPNKEIKIFNAKIVVGADGANSIVNRILGNNTINPKHHSAGLRMYYENVTHFNAENYIELHFIKEILPGYLWLFPLPNNQVNVGIGMLTQYVSSKKVNLKTTLENVLETHPNFKERFKNATRLETVKGFGLPLGDVNRSISGNRYILLGDAAGLIDPFSGEGIGNAIRSGRIGAKHIIDCMVENNFSIPKNKTYDKAIYKTMGAEFKASKWLQRLCRYPKILNFIVRKANRNEALRSFLIGTMEDVDKKKMLRNPIFYFKLLFY